MLSVKNLPDRFVRGLVTAAMLGTFVAGATYADAAGAATAPPTQPGPVTVGSITSSTAVLSWTKSSDVLGIEGYQVWIGPHGGAMRQIATTDGGITKYTLKTLYANSAYDVSVIALDTAGQNSTPSTTATSPSLTTLPSSNTTPPAPPADTSVAAHPFSDTRIDVSWGRSPTADVVGYRVFRDADPTPIATIDLPNGLRYSDGGLAPGSKHTYAIEAVDSAGLPSAATTPKPPATATTLATGAVQLARGPYLSNVTGTSAIVSWWTNIASSGVVRYGIGSPTASANDPAGSAQHHAVKLTGLIPGRAYAYTVGNGSVTSVQSTFRTAANPGTTYSFAAIGDFGGGSPGETQNATNIAADGTSFIQTVGDNIYASAGSPEPDFNTVYSDYDARLFKPFAAALRSQPFFPANGNQEYYSNGAFWKTFPMLGTNHGWYSYDWGDAHILVLDSEVALDPSSPQYAFAQSDLASHQGAQFRIVSIQRPPYSSSSATSSSKVVQQNLVPLFQQEHVSLVLSGNSHNYERSFPILNGAKNPNGVTYIVTGGGGNGHNPFTIAQPAWSAFRDATRYEYAKVTVSTTSLRVDAIDAATNKVFDTTTIKASSFPGAVVPVAAHRVLDTTRGVGAPRRLVAAGTTMHIPVRGGSTGVPANASAVLLSMWNGQAARNGAVSVFPDGGSPVAGGNLTAIQGRTNIGQLLVAVGSNGKVAVTNATGGAVNLTGDVIGYVRGGVSNSVPGAVVMSAARQALNTTTGMGAARRAVPAHGAVRFLVRGGSTGVPGSATAALLTLRSWQVSKPGAVAVFPDGGRAGGQNLSAVPGRMSIAQLLVPIGADGKVALVNGTGGAMQLAAQISGYVQGGASGGVVGAIVPIGVHQVLATTGGIGAPRRAVPAHGTLHVTVTGAGVPANATAVVINLTSLNVRKPGSVRVFRDGAPAASGSIAAWPGVGSYGQIVVPVASNGKIAVQNNTNGLLDVAGYVIGYVRRA